LFKLLLNYLKLSNKLVIFQINVIIHNKLIFILYINVLDFKVNLFKSFKLQHIQEYILSKKN
jgi:hypothetical protein